ncbi:hypothetical protein F2Q68_00044033 [Brassica cretica]|uniref:Uncharacterized protein n=1 Tax=Brassica cretica TaxID=69181 RepID=A0A8S9LFX6_BRACR|nr:hypothetical protein F2Q68_00044033 [Brassica cretica]
MVATLILVRDERGDQHDQEGHQLNAAGQRIDAPGAEIPEGHNTRNPTATTEAMEIPTTISHHHILRRARLKRCLTEFLRDSSA